MVNVFISHRGCDAADAEKLADELRQAGHNVWLDLWQIRLGDSITGRMNEGLEGATDVVVCYSSAGVSTPWMSREWLSALARQLQGCSIRLIPVVLTGGSPPAILADIKYVDLAADWDSGIAELLGVL